MLMNRTATQIILHADLEGIEERRDGESKKKKRMKTKKRKIAILRHNLKAPITRTSLVLL